MCGINGILKINPNYDIRSFENKINQMNETIIHRGPDSGGVYVNNPIGQGFRRLSIIDLSDAGNQPMLSQDKSISLVFNGEIYNYLELIEELKTKGHVFSTKTDTEVIIHAYQEWGTDCVNRFNGMWGFALYDFKNELFFASRDRMGVKPFYYHLNKDYLVFSSETKAILKVESFREANRAKAFEYIAYGYNKTNDGETFVEKINELLPGTNLLVDKKGVKFEKYWTLTTDMYKLNPSKTISEEFTLLFEDALKLRYRSDVPIGILLSGGLDSSVITKITDDLIKKGELAQNKIMAYTAHFPGLENDEYKIALEFSKTCKNIELKSITPDLNEVTKNLDDIIYGLDQPVLGFNSIVHNLLMKEIRKDGIVVTLNGQGADEAYYGYEKHIFGYLLLILK